MAARRSRGFGHFLIVAASLIGVQAARAQAQSVDLVQPDPSVIMGRLPNGLRYAVKQQRSHQKEVINFYVDAGSVEEAEGEHGVAHFLEHMAFNGSRNFPAATLIKTFEEAGIGFGRDQNAFTTYLNTRYVLDIPNETPDKLDLSFRWLRDVADGLLIDPVEVDRERGVILSEYRQGEGPFRNVTVKKLKFLLPGLKVSDHLPIGDLPTILGAKAETIRGFYTRWYRPETVIIVAVGDEPALTMKRRIEDAFSTWRNPTPAPPRPDLGHVDFQRPSAAGSFADSHVVGALGLCRYGPKPVHHPEDVAVTRDRLADQIWTSVFARRMGRLARSDAPPFLSAAANHSVSLRAVAETCFSAVEKQDDWRSALAALSSEVGRLERYGLTKREFEEARTQIEANDDAAVASAATRSPESLVAVILDNMVEDNTFDTAEEQRRIDALALNSLTLEGVNAAFHNHWTEASPALIFTVGPAPIPSTALMAAAAAAPQAPPPVDETDKPWVYGDAARPGRVVKRVEFKDPDFVRLSFANGLILNFKQTDFSKNSVLIHILFGAGQQEIPPGNAFDATIAGSVLQAGALERNDTTDITDICRGHACSAALQVARTDFILNGTTRPGDLDLELQILGAFLREPGFRPTMAAAMPTVASAFYRGLQINPSLLASNKLEEISPRPHVSDLPPEAHVASLDAEDFKALLRGPLTQDPVEVTLVGDVDEQTAVAAVAKTLGALPERAPGDRTRPDAAHVRFDARPPAPITIRHRGAQDQAFVQFTWPLYVWSPALIHESRALNLMARTLQDAVLDRVRQSLAKSYSPTVAVSLPRGGDQASLSVKVLTTPAAAAQVRDEISKIAAGFASNGVSPEQFARARTPWLDALAKARTYNSWWMSTLDGSSRYPDKLLSAREGLADLQRVTLAEVNHEATLWLALQPYVITVLPEAATPAPGQGPAEDRPNPHFSDDGPSGADQP